MNRTEIINTFIEYNKYKSYLEIGVSTGSNFNNIKCKDKIGVDPEPKTKISNVVRKTSDKFFEENTKEFDIIFIDGLHHYDQVKRDLDNSLNFLSSNGTIVVHDCSPTTELMQKVPREAKVWTGDVWKAWVEFIRDSHLNYELFTIDTDMGVGVVRPGSSSYNISLPDNLTYSWFKDNKTRALNLISVKEFKTKLND